MSELPAANAAREGEARLAASPLQIPTTHVNDTFDDADLLPKVRAVIASRAETKRRRLYAMLIEGMLTNRKLTRFDAERLGCHVWNTSAHQIGKDGLVVSREPVVLDGRFGPVHCKAYWIERDQLPRALHLLGVQS